MTSFDALGRERYVSLASFRRSGAEVRTPVWIAADAGRLLVFTNGTSGKVKRIRNDGRVRLAPCDVRGTLRGDFVPGRARLLDDPAERERALALLRAKYGWQMRLVQLGARIGGRHAQRAAIEITPT